VIKLELFHDTMSGLSALSVGFEVLTAITRQGTS
jgi:hypothetical protein